MIQKPCQGMTGLTDATSPVSFPDLTICTGYIISCQQHIFRCIEMNYTYKTQPYKHQRDAFKASADQKNYAYFMEMGCGKSKVLIDNAAYLYAAGADHFSCNRSTERRLPELGAERDTHTHARQCPKRRWQRGVAQ